MDFKFSCPSCGQHIAVTGADVGTSANCPSCNAALTIPPPSLCATEEPEAIAEEAPESQQQKALKYLQHLLGKGRSSAVLADFRDLDLKAEVLPVGQHTFALLKADFVFWAVTLLAVVPLFLVTLEDTQAQLTGFCLFFAAIWGLVFKRFVIEETGGWRAPLAALFFTGLVSMQLLLQLYDVFPNVYMELSESEHTFTSLIGLVLRVGVWEEMCKIVPVLLYIGWKRSEARPLTIILVGVFSGLGFAAFENLHYADKAIVRSAVLTDRHGIEGLKAGVQGAMVNVMLRSMSAVFGHAVYSGIFAYFLTVAWLTRKRIIPLVLIGLGVAATIHGLYNWFWMVQTTLPALVTAFGFMLFYAYLTKLRLLIASMSTGTLAASEGERQPASVPAHPASVA